MSGSHPVASGSIPGIGCLLFAFLAQSAERCANNFSLSESRKRFSRKRNGRRFDPGRKLTNSTFLLPGWRNGSAPAYGAGGCGFESHVGLVEWRKGKPGLLGSFSRFFFSLSSWSAFFCLAGLFLVSSRFKKALASCISMQTRRGSTHRP